MQFFILVTCTVHLLLSVARDENICAFVSKELSFATYFHLRTTYWWEKFIKFLMYFYKKSNEVKLLWHLIHHIYVCVCIYIYIHFFKSKFTVALLYLQIAGESLRIAFTDQVIHYHIKTSLFDIVVSIFYHSLLISLITEWRQWHSVRHNFSLFIGGAEIL